ncbi:response regulator transcription factor [Noviherbaspirillum sp. Root189]|uniref:response regulator transcription factor n=1 Tax=Noviherbaspirillum sp. Root189 TaxID=1736487 RepID=UPI00070946CD|nr:response regulator transcription factor [Noviherbaspirillum sp. Root189]KRB67778.1 two-component system response regulator [Noviherbaspirillum sp. Root189]
MNVLIIEDNPDIIANLFGFLEPLGYILDIARNGPIGLERAIVGGYDVIVLDLSLPGIDGIEVCRRLREDHQIAAPILMLTARDTECDKLAGFDVGADDYLVKPYSLLELDARLKALLRRSRNEQVKSLLRFGDLHLDTGTGQVMRAGKPLTLTPTGYKILRALVRQAPRLLTREALEREVWGDNPPESDALRTHIHALRQSLDKPFSRAMLITLPGTGYRLADSDEDA